MQQPIFLRQSTGPSPFLGIRDWVVFFAILVLAALAMMAIAKWIGFGRGVTGAMLAGGLMGALPSVFVCLPVRGIVPPGLKHQFLAAIFDMGFNLERKDGDQSFYVYKSPRWMRWDSNRVTLCEEDGKDIVAHIPLYVFKALKVKKKI